MLTIHQPGRESSPSGSFTTGMRGFLATRHLPDEVFHVRAAVVLNSELEG
jgi:hypothetical protein